VRSSTGTPDRLVAVAVPVPGLGLLTYRVPAGFPAPPKGARVRVPLGSRAVAGCVVDADAASPEGASLRDVTAVLDTEPFLPPAVVDLALWVGDYSASGPGDALAVAMPPSARRGEAAAFKTVSRARLAPSGLEEAVAAVRGSKQLAALAALRAAPNGLTLREL
jgi:primosomal protein N' (replication factor Y)